MNPIISLGIVDLVEIVNLFSLYTLYYIENFSSVECIKLNSSFIQQRSARTGTP